jgi:hypothetical protein
LEKIQERSLIRESVRFQIKKTRAKLRTEAGADILPSIKARTA